MRKFGVFAALTLSWITISCAEKMVHPAVIPLPTSPKAVSKPRPPNVEARRQALLPQKPPQPKQNPLSRERTAVMALPPLEPAEPSFPVAARMPPPPDPAEPSFPSTPPAIVSSPREPPATALPDVLLEAAMPAPPDPAEPSFPVASLVPPVSAPAEPSLPQSPQEQIAAGGPIAIPLPDPPAYLSLRPRFDWVDTVGAIELPHSPPFKAPDAGSGQRIPSLIQYPWPLSLDGT